MNIAQLKIVAWTAAGLLGAGLAAYVGSFVLTLDERQALPDAEEVRSTLAGVVPAPVKDDGQVGYADLQRLFHTMNWTGAPKVVAKPPDEIELPVGPQVIPVRELVRVLWVQVDLTQPEGSAVFVKYKARAQVTNPSVGGFLLREGDKLASPHDHVRVASIAVEGVTFKFADEAREAETLIPAEFDAKTQIVQVGPDGVVVPPPSGLIPVVSGSGFKPGKTTALGRDRMILGTEDLAYAETNYSEILARDLSTRQHRDPRTGRYDGIEITRVTPGSFAARHGASEGDVVRSINGNPVSSTQDAIHFVRTNKDRYSTWEVVIENRGRTRTVTYESPND